LRERYAEGAGKTSVPVVVYVKADDEKGSIMSGEEGEVETGAVWWSKEVELKGYEESSRIACVIVV